MNKLILWMLSFALLTTMMTGCGPAPTSVIPTLNPSRLPLTSTPKPAPVQQARSSPIPVLVSPFYSSEGIQVHVGNYSQQLETADHQELTGLAQEMAQHRDELTPEQMFVLAIRLYDLGEKDDSVYWFYEAQFRAKLYLTSLDPAQTGSSSDVSFELLADYDAFTKLAGEFINGYAGCDVDNWVRIASLVKNDNPSPPELDQLFPGAVFVERSLWQTMNDEVSDGLGFLIAQLVVRKDSIRQQRVADNLDARYCQ